MAAEAAHEDAGTHVDPDATAGPGLRAWLRDQSPIQGAHAATFDTRLDKAPWFTGVASRGIARRLRHKGYDVIATESFLVQDSEGPLEKASSIGRERGASSSRRRSGRRPPGLQPCERLGRTLIAAWFAILFTGRYPRGLFGYLEGVIR